MKKEKNIIKTVCDYFQLTDKELFKKTRLEDVVYPRQILFYLMKKHTNLSYRLIGKLGHTNYDYATVIHSEKVIANFLDSERNLKGAKKTTKDLETIEQWMVKPLKKNKMFKIKEDVKTLKKELSQLRKAMNRMETSLKIQENMKHQKLRIS